MQYLQDSLDDFELDDAKDVFQFDPPRFEVVEGTAGRVFDVFTGETWIGRVQARETNEPNPKKTWDTVWLPELKDVKPDSAWYGFETAEKAGQWLLQYWMRRLSVKESEDDDLEFLDPKSFGSDYPVFELKFAGSLYKKRVFNVIAEGRFIGSVESLDNTWHIVFIKKQETGTYIKIENPEAGAQLLWQGEMGLVELPVIPVPPYHIPPPEESITDKAARLVDVLIEGDDLGDDLKDAADFSQPGIIVSLLKDAGFEIIRSDIIDGTMYIEFTWAAGNTVAYVNGWRRAKELINPYIKLSNDNYVVSKSGKGPDAIATALIIKHVEDDPNLWKIAAAVQGHEGHAAGFWYISFEDKVVGEVFLQVFNSLSSHAEKFRELLARLHKIVPFRPEDWPKGGDAWGRGPAILWWKANWRKLPDAEKVTYQVQKELK